MDEKANIFNNIDINLGNFEFKKDKIPFMLECSKCYRISIIKSKKKSEAAMKFEKQGWSLDKRKKLICPQCIK
jgi:hypothetical protein